MTIRRLKSTLANLAKAGIPPIHERRLKTLQRLAIAVFVFIAASHIISAAHLGVSGHHPWRQSDVYGHILGFMHARGFTPLNLFAVGIVKWMYDAPIYQYLIAKAALLTSADPLVATRHLNFGFWALAAFAGYRLSLFVGGGARVAGLVFVYLFATAPLMLHYYSAPMPDTMGIALSLVGVAVLARGGASWKSALCAAPFLMPATFIKSPIVFVFVAFYGIYVLIDRAAARPAAGPAGPRLDDGYKPFIALGVVLFACAILADQLRPILSDIPRRHWAVVDRPRLNFAAWEARLSAQLWRALWNRLNELGLPYGYLYAAGTVAALSLRRDRRLAALISASAGAYVLGWLVFMWHHQKHDYYLMPALCLVFISIAVSIARVCAWARERLPLPVSSRLAAVALVGVMAAALAQSISAKPPGARHRDDFYAGIAYALRGETVFLHVYAGKSPFLRDPGLGGLLSTRFRRASRADFENDCANYLARYAAIVYEGEGDSACLAANKRRAKHYIEDHGLTFYLRADNG